MSTAVLSSDPGLMSRTAADSTDDFLRLARSHQKSAFQIVYGLLRDELAAETITNQVFTRARRRFSAFSTNSDAATATFWIYHATLRFACRYYWKKTPPKIRRHLETCAHHGDDFDLKEFVRVLALHPGKINPQDCELISLRHVVGLSLSQIGRLLCMHPYEISNRLTWSRERVNQLRETIPSFYQRT